MSLAIKIIEGLPRGGLSMRLITTSSSTNFYAGYRLSASKAGQLSSAGRQQTCVGRPTMDSAYVGLDQPIQRWVGRLARPLILTFTGRRS